MSRVAVIVSLALAVSATPHALAAQAPSMAHPVPEGRWTANIRPTLSITGNIGSSTKRMYGTAKIVPSKSGPPNSWDVEIHLTNDRPSETLMWSIVPGRCGSGSLPLATASELPFLEVTANANADVSANVRFPLDSNASYHLDIFRGGTQQEHVIACAGLKHGR